MDIFSKRSGPREEDKQAKEHLQRNWGTIEKLADQISGGGYSKNKARTSALDSKASQQSSGLIFVDQAARPTADVSVPYLRISMNGRVVIADKNSGLQTHFVGQLKRVNGQTRFQIATAENGYITPLDAGMFELIRDLADKTLGSDYSEAQLSHDLKSRLCID